MRVSSFILREIRDEMALLQEEFSFRASGSRGAASVRKTRCFTIFLRGLLRHQRIVNCPLLCFRYLLPALRAKISYIPYVSFLAYFPTSRLLSVASPGSLYAAFP